MSNTNYKYVRRIEQKFPCGCHIDEMIDESYGITYCPKHDAASDMYEALKEIKQLLDTHELSDVVLQQVLTAKCYLALSKAKGK